MKILLVSNNPLVKEKFSLEDEFIFLEGGTFKDVLKVVREKVHLGHKLLTHPLTSSIKPGETPFKSVVLSLKQGNLDFPSLELIENSILTVEKFKNHRKWTNQIIEDFQVIDCDIIFNGIESIKQFS